MTLAEFIESCPTELRLGQYFYNCYLYKLRPEDRMHEATQELHNTICAHAAFEMIKEIMEDYQWKEMPQYE